MRQIFEKVVELIGTGWLSHHKEISVYPQEEDIYLEFGSFNIILKDNGEWELEDFTEQLK